MNNKDGQKEIIFEGLPASPGIAIGMAAVLSRESLEFSRKEIEKRGIAEEIERFHKAIDKTRGELETIRKRVLNRLGEKAAELFDAHLMILDDKIVIDKVIKRIREERRNAEWVYFELLQEFHNTMSGTEDEYLKERGMDILDVKRRVIRNLTGSSPVAMAFKGPRIVVGHQLTPSQTVMMDRNAILGFAIDLGGKTSHVVILAKGLEKPAVVGAKKLSENVVDGDRLIVDGNSGSVILNPSKNTLLQYRQLQEKYQEFQQALLPIKELPAKTMDGHEVALPANVDLPNEVDSALEHGARGIGLFRSEYIYLDKKSFPEEEEQYQEYVKVVDRVYPHMVKIRTFDLGGDRILIDKEHDEESNPFLGWRSIRISLDMPDMLVKQLRAILRVSRRNNVRIMFPMISSIEELRRSKALLEEVKQMLRNEKIEFDEQIEVGIMVEVPSTVMLADHFAKEVNFFSIGTNDLIQYALAVDRGNDRIAHLYTNYHPAVLRMIKQTVEIGHKNGIWVALCGEMASDLLIVPFLVGIGLDELSLSSSSIPKVKELIRSSRFNSMKRVVEDVLECATSEEVEERLRAFMRRELSQFSDVMLSELVKRKDKTSKEPG